MDLRILRIGIQSFRKIRDCNCYVDKTDCALRLFREGSHCFLSWPRRFGKSLLVDTLKHLLEGGQELFGGLDAYSRWDWSVRYPVVRLDFPGLNATSPAYSAICDFTDTDLDTAFAAELATLDREQIREWYGGYSWDGNVRSTTLSISCFCLPSANSRPDGFRQARRRSWWRS